MGHDMGQITIQLFYSNTAKGPTKVIDSIKSGLTHLNIQCLSNDNIIENTKKICLSQHNILHSKNISELIIGPNICVLPKEDNVVLAQKYKKFIVPSQWTYDLYSRWIDVSKLAIWPAGIQTEKFIPANNDINKKYDCLIYFKRRSEEDLQFVVSTLNRLNKTYKIIKYNEYDENEFINTIHLSKIGIVIDKAESQGIAIEEMMSCNLPLLVWDIQSWSDQGPENECAATSVPYWDNMCGIKFFNKEELESNIINITNNIYTPRKFILNNLDINTSTQKLLKLLED
jgi:hypothetical protein